jgi:hypothetical protein
MLFKIWIKVLLTCAVFLCPQATLRVQSDSNPPRDKSEWIFNYPSSPLVVTAVGDRAFELTNVGRSAIIAYQLGCIAFHDSRPSILTTEEKKSADIAVSDKEETIAMHVLQERLKCVQNKAKLSVVWVRFNDEAEWAAGRPPSESGRVAIP